MKQRVIKRHWSRWASALCTLCFAAQWTGAGASGARSSIVHPAPAVALDRFGGVRPRVVHGTGFFGVEKNNTRWVLVTPDGDLFWMRAVYAVDWNDGGAAGQQALQQKYHGDPSVFARHTTQRLQSWGFNTLGEYSSSYAYPVPTFGRSQGNPDQMPFIRYLNISWYGAINYGHLAPAPFKTLLAGAVDTEVYHGWPGHIPDVFDPNFEIYARALAADMRTGSSDTVFTEKTWSGGLPQPSLVNNPWLIGTTPDDTDNLFGFGPGPDIPGRDGVIHPHIAWIVAVTKPLQSINADVGTVVGAKQTVEYEDPVVYTKRAWRDFLEKKYGTIARLNSTWGSNYTTFDSDGGWPQGKGLMDESGRHRWIGDDPARLSTTAPAVKNDLNAFLAIYADRYFHVVHDAVRAATPHQLLFSPAVLDSHDGMTRPEILQAAGRYCDVLQIGADVGNPEVIDKTYALTGKPMFVWMGLRANPDSPMQGRTREFLDLGTQAQRGERYAQEVREFFSHRTPDGTFPLVGLDWWEYMDKAGEASNWGLVTPRDNAYDGREDVVMRGKDDKGFSTGGEERNYGDFLSAVVKANSELNRQLAAEVARQSAQARAPVPRPTT